MEIEVWQLRAVPTDGAAEGGATKYVYLVYIHVTSFRARQRTRSRMNYSVRSTYLNVTRYLEYESSIEARSILLDRGDMSCGVIGQSMRLRLGNEGRIWAVQTKEMRNN